MRNDSRGGNDLRSWRGFMHDCGRNFLDVESVKNVIDLMAKYKLNLFHWHLTDYWGWRLESKKYPMLQAPWAFGRQHGKMQRTTQGESGFPALSA